MPETDASIIERSLDDPSAFAPIFERHYDAIARYLCRRAGQSVGEELAADTFVTALELRARFDLSRDNSLPWLYGIATNLLRHHFRSERAKNSSYERYSSLSAIPESFSVEDKLDAQAKLGLLTQALETLDAGDRETLLLFAWADLSYAEIAEALQIPIGTVRSKLNRVRRRLRELIALEGEKKQ